MSERQFVVLGRYFAVSTAWHLINDSCPFGSPFPIIARKLQLQNSMRSILRVPNDRNFFREKIGEISNWNAQQNEVREVFLRKGTLKNLFLSLLKHMCRNDSKIK